MVSFIVTGIFFFSSSSYNSVLFIHSPYSGHQQDSYYETYTNIYEDVENMNKFTLSQNSTKRKGGLKSKYFTQILFLK